MAMPAKPPLNAIHVFCEAARCGSFKLAAQSLCVTPGAVSRQIQALEAYLGQPLFERRPGAVALTRPGRQLHAGVSDKMAAVASEVQRLRSGGRKQVLRVDSGVTVAMHWLIPRLSGFTEAHPGVQVQVSTSDGPIDLRKPVDVVIRRNPAELRGLPSQVFMQEHSVLVASPRFARGKASATARTLQRWPRIGARSRPDLWPQWSAHHGLAALEPTLEFDNTVLAIQAAAEGLGAMVVPELFVRGLLEGGSLVLLDAVRVPTGSYSCALRSGRAGGAARRFVSWLSEARLSAIVPITTMLPSPP